MRMVLESALLLVDEGLSEIHDERGIQAEGRVWFFLKA